MTRRSQRTETVREPATDWRVTMKRRTLVAAAMLGLWAVGIEARLVKLQVVDHADLVARAERQQRQIIIAPAKRGDILDRRGHLLATSVDADSVYAVPSLIADKADAVAKLCGALDDCTLKDKQTLLDHFNKQKAFAYVRRQVTPDESKRVSALNLDGISFIKESQRFYPNRELAAHLLGWVGVDNNGLSGIESTYDTQIHGKDGKVLIHSDAKRHAFDRLEQAPVAGSSIELTIDEYLQHVAERELHQGVVENKAAGGSAIIMNPHTGEILAMANEPTFNPNDYRSAPDAERRNRAVQDVYEPGSTFKLVTASAAIEGHVMPLDSMIDTSPGRIQIGNTVVSENEGHDYGVLSFSDVIADSSNVGAIKIGFKVGKDLLSEYVQRYGFGHSVSPDFPGESPGIVWDAAKWNDGVLAHVAIGYQVAVTPLQMVAAVSSIANGGAYIEPRVVRAVYRDNRRYVVQPKVLREPIDGRHRRDADDDHGRRRRHLVRHRDRRADAGLHGRRQDGHRGEAYQSPVLQFRLQRVICRLPAVPRPGGRDHRRGRFAPWQRLLRRRGFSADLQTDRGIHASLPGRRADDQPRAARDRRPPAERARVAGIGSGPAQIGREPRR